MPITVHNTDGSVTIVSLKKTAAPAKPVVKPPPVRPAKDIATLRAEFEVARERKHDAQAPGKEWAYASANKAYNELRKAIMKTQHPNLHRRLALAEEVLALSEEEYEPESRSCYHCGGTYSHATKEADDEDTGFCPDAACKSARHR
jgi:hypothetical protein